MLEDWGSGNTVGGSNGCGASSINVGSVCQHGNLGVATPLPPPELKACGRKSPRQHSSNGNWTLSVLVSQGQGVFLNDFGGSQEDGVNTNTLVGPVLGFYIFRCVDTLAGSSHKERKKGIARKEMGGISEHYAIFLTKQVCKLANRVVVHNVTSRISFCVGVQLGNAADLVYS